VPFVSVGADTNNPLRLAFWMSNASSELLCTKKDMAKDNAHQNVTAAVSMCKVYLCSHAAQLAAFNYTTVDHLLRTSLIAKFFTHPLVAAFCLLALPNDSATVIDKPCHHDFLHRTAGYLIHYILRLLCI
jgi:hypothetical protein